MRGRLVMWQLIWYGASMAKMLDVLRHSIEVHPENREQIARGSGVTAGQLSRLMSGERGLSPDSIEMVAEYLGLEIIIRPKRRNRKAGK